MHGSASHNRRDNYSPSTNSDPGDKNINGDSTKHNKTSSVASWLRDAGLFVVCFLNVPMWSMAICLAFYVGLVLAVAQFHPAALTVVLGYLVWVLADAAGPSGRRRPLSSTSRERLRNLPWFRWTAEYFPVSLIQTVELDNKRPYLFLYHPHGVIGMGANIALTTNGCQFDQVFPGIQRHGITLNAPFLCPFFREYLIALGFLNADRDTLRRTLQSGHSIVLVPGGASEALYASPNTFQLTTKRHAGFLRLALETGALPVPCIAFGENEAFSVCTFPPHSTVFAIQERLHKLLSFSTPWLKSPLCQRHPIHVVVGEPVIFGTKNASLPDVQTHYLLAVETLYNQHKDKYGHGNIPLEWI